MDLGRAAWIATVAVAIIAAVLMLAAGYYGYGALSLTIAASAAINLRD